MIALKIEFNINFMNYLSLLYEGSLSGLVFLIKFGICFYMYKMVRESANKMKFESLSNFSIYRKQLYNLVIASLILTGIQYGNDGASCVGGDPLYGGCDYYDYDDDFIPMTFENAIKLFFTYFIIVLVIGYYGIKKGIEDAEINLSFNNDSNRTFEK